jgi:Ca2+/Na+ antiporter
MSNKVKKIMKNPWIITIVGGIIVFLFTSILKSVISDINFINSIKFISLTLFSYGKFILLFKIPIWILILFFIGILIIIYIIFKLDSEDPPWIRYRRDYVNDMLFTWDYNRNLGKVKIKNLRPICSNCGCELSKGIDHSSASAIDKHCLYCPNCNKKFKMINKQTLNDVKKIIINRINNDDYQQKESMKKLKG